MQIQNKNIQDLEQDPENARKHDQRNLEAIKKSLETFGQQKPIVINKDGKVVAGNGTLEAAKDLGWKEIQTVTTDLKDQEEKAYAIADNRTAELADWDYQTLAEQLKSLKLDEMELSNIGWEPHEFEPLLQSDFDPRMTAYGGDGETDTAIRALKLTAEQRDVVNRAVNKVREDEDDPTMTEGRCVELICADFIA